MNSPTKSAPLGPGELTAEDAERFAALFKPIWELDDAPFAQAKPGALTGNDVQHLAQAGIRPDVHNGTSVAAGPHAPPAAYRPGGPLVEDNSVVLDIEPDPTPAVQAQPQPQHPMKGGTVQMIR